MTHPRQNYKPTLVFLVVLFLVLFGFAYFIYYSSAKLLEQHLKQEILTNAHLIARLASEKQKGIINYLSSFAQRPHFITAVKERNRPQALKHLKQLIQIVPDYERPFISDPQGIVWVSYPEQEKHYNKSYAYRDWYKGVSKNWRPYTSALYKRTVYEQDVAATIAIPVKDDENRIIGILALPQRRQSFADFFAPFTKTTNYKFALVDKVGNIIYHPTVIGKEELIAYPAVPALTQVLEKKADLTETDLPYMKRALVAYIPVPDTNWAVLLELPKDQAFAPLSRIFWILFPLSVALYGLAAAAYLYAQRRHRQNLALLAQVKDYSTSLEEMVRQKTKEVKDAWNFLLTVNDSLHDAVFCVTYPERLIDYCNNAVKRIFGYSPQELMGKSAQILFSDEESYKDLGAKLQKALSDKGYMEIEQVYKKKNGELFWAQVTTSFLNDEEQQPKFIASILRDITKEKQAQEESERLQAQLIQAQKMEAVGTLAGGIAHDFNNILAGIIMHTSLAKLQLGPDHTLYQSIDGIEQSAERAAVLAKQLLGFARGGKYQVKILNLNQAAQNIWGLIRRTFDRKIEIETHYAPDLWAMEGDQGQLEQCLLNLCLNARDAMPQGGRLTIATQNTYLDEEFVRTHAGAKTGDYVLFSVKDTGAGISPQNLPRIFEPFFTTKGQGEGTGLGLAMVYGIVKNHGGYLEVLSESGQGSCFNIYLPAKKEVVLPEAKTKREKASLDGAGEGTILLVDDEENLLEAAGRLLTAVGYRVLKALNGVEALEIYRQEGENIDLVILDIIMPQMGGQETFNTLKALNPQVKVLLSSGYSIEGQAQEILKAGAQGFLQKPYRAPALVAKIKEILGSG